MKDRAAAHRYARALGAALDGDGELTRIADELGMVARLMASDPDLTTALTSPGVEAGRRRALLESLAREGRLSTAASSFLGILADHRRLALLPDVATLVARMRDQRLGIVEAEVTSATALSPEEEDRARKALEHVTGRKVRLTLKTDPALIGGLVAQVGSKVYDASIRTRLEALRYHLARN